MIEVDEIREIIREEFDPDCCVVCLDEITFIDALGIRWCAKHEFRGQFVEVMAARDWQEILSSPFLTMDENGQESVKYYSIATGAWFTVQIALVGTDEVIIALALKAMEDHQIGEQVA